MEGINFFEVFKTFVTEWMSAAAGAANDSQAKAFTKT
jgi:hypothetical protein